MPGFLVASLSLKVVNEFDFSFRFLKQFINYYLLSVSYYSLCNLPSLYFILEELFLLGTREANNFFGMLSSTMAFT